MPKPTVVVIDDDELFLRMLSRAVERADDLELVGTAADGDAGLELLRASPPRVALIDLELPGRSGLDIIEACVALPLRAVLMSARMTDAHAERARRFGATALHKSAGPRAILAAARRAAEPDDVPA